MFQEGEKEMGIIPAVLRDLLDARKCISYLTIEYWDKPIPEDLKDKMKG